ncbi:hypothetical protein HAP99_06310, partial [Acidithiobacillus caldus]|nr:hypothetical protein [Acidithiobacillus caldus]
GMPGGQGGYGFGGGQGGTDYISSLVTNAVTSTGPSDSVNAAGANGSVTIDFTN